MSVRLILAGVVLAAAAVPAFAQTSQLVTNGSFDGGVLPVDPDPVFSSVPGWTLSFVQPPNLIRLGTANHNYGGGILPSGGASLDNPFITFGEGNNGTTGTLSQVLAGTIGVTTVNFGLGVVGSPVGAQLFTATVVDNISGLVLGQQAYSPGVGTSWDDVFQDATFNYVGSGNAVTLLFTAFGSDTTGADIVLDDVSAVGTLAATDVPEPASWAMMVGGFGLIGAALRRRRTTTVTFA